MFASFSAFETPVQGHKNCQRISRFCDWHKPAALLAVIQKYFTPQMAVVSPPSLNLPTRKRYLNHDKVIFPKIQTRNVLDWLKFVKR